MLLALFNVVDMLLWLLGWIIIASAILSWLVAFNVINTHNDFMRNLLYALDRMTEPLFRPIRKILPDFGGIDFSPLVVLILIMAIRMLLDGAERSLMLSGY
jgi:YggT family protein